MDRDKRKERTDLYFNIIKKNKITKSSVEEYIKTVENLKATLANAGIKENVAAPIIDMAEIDNVDALIQNERK